MHARTHTQDMLHALHVHLHPHFLVSLHLSGSLSQSRVLCWSLWSERIRLLCSDWSCYGGQHSLYLSPSTSTTPQYNCYRLFSMILCHHQSCLSFFFFFLICTHSVSLSSFSSRVYGVKRCVCKDGLCAYFIFNCFIVCIFKKSF